MIAGASVWRGYLAATYLPWGMDEFATWWAAANKDYLEMLLWNHHDTHPPLNYILVRACMQLTGLQEMWVLRLPSCAFSILSIPAAYWLGRALWGRWSALAFAGAVCFSPFLVHQAHNARMYSGHVFLTLITLAVIARMCARHNSRRTSWALLGALAGCLAWMSSTGLIVAGAIWVGLPLGWILPRMVGNEPEEEVRLEWRRFAEGYFISGVVFLTLMTPAIVKFGCQYLEADGLLLGGEFREPLLVSLERMGVFQTAGAGLGTAAALIGLNLESRRRPVLCSILMLMAIIGIGVPVWQGRLASRYMLTAHVSTLIGVVLFLKHALGTRKGMQGAALVLLVALFALGNFRGPYVNTLMAARLLSLRPSLEKDSRVYITPSWTNIMFNYYGIDALHPGQLEVNKIGLILLGGTRSGVAYLFAQPPGNDAERESYEGILLSLASHYEVKMTRQQALAWTDSDMYLTFKFGEGLLEVLQYP